MTDDIRKTIFSVLYASQRGLSLANIEKKVKGSRQSVFYNLKRLMVDGVVVKEGTLYYLQPFLYSSTIRDAILGSLKQIIGEIGIAKDEAMPVESAITNGLHYLVCSLNAELSKIF